MDLKKYFDRAKSDSDESVRLQNELDILFNDGTDEGIQAAIDLQPSLEAATKKAQESNRLYLSVRDAANMSGNAASLFVPNSEQPEEDEGEDGEKKMTLAAFNALAPKARLAFAKNGGQLVN